LAKIHSREIGTNENINGLIHKHLPKKTDFQNITQEELNIIQNNLNNRQKKFNYSSPLEFLSNFGILTDENKVLRLESA